MDLILIQLNLLSALQEINLLSDRYLWFSDDMKKVLSAGREFYNVIECCTGFALDLAPQYLHMWLVRYGCLLLWLMHFEKLVKRRKDINNNSTQISHKF